MRDGAIEGASPGASTIPLKEEPVPFSKKKLYLLPFISPISLAPLLNGTMIEVLSIPGFDARRFGPPKMMKGPSETDKKAERTQA